MKKFLVAVSSMLVISQAVVAQDSDNFDKKFRFGLRVAPQPTWLSSSDANTSKDGSKFGFGFGLVTEFKLSDNIHFATGIGGDFEGGKISYRDDYSLSNPNGYSVGYVTDNNGDLIQLKNGMKASELGVNGNKAYGQVISRKVSTTFVSIPLTLKMLTKEISGFRYFGVFGGELGIRVKAKAEDTYLNSTTYNSTGGSYSGSGTLSKLNIGPDASAVPLRFGLNVGAGAEYRLAGTTSLFMSVNYFRSFTNLMRKESKYAATASQYYASDGTLTFTQLKQNLFANAVRINVGVLF